MIRVIRFVVRNLAGTGPPFRLLAPGDQGPTSPWETQAAPELCLGGGVRGLYPHRLGQEGQHAAERGVQLSAREQAGTGAVDRRRDTPRDRQRHPVARPHWECPTHHKKQAISLALVALLGCYQIRVSELPPERTVPLKNEHLEHWIFQYEDEQVPPIKFVLNGVEDFRHETGQPRDDKELGETLVTFVHLSDVQLYDERITMVNRLVHWIVDRIVPSAAFDSAQQKYDAAVYLTLIKALNSWDRELCESRGASSPENPLFAVHTGDALHADVYQELWEFLTISHRLELPWFPVIGNHDVMTFGTKTPGSVGVIRPTVASLPLQDAQNFMKLHHGKRSATFPPGIQIIVPHEQKPPLPDPCLDRPTAQTWRGAFQPFHSYFLGPTPLAPPPAGEGPGYYAWSAEIDWGTMPDSWHGPRTARSFPLRLLFLNTAEFLTLSEGGVSETQVAWLKVQLDAAGARGEYVLAFGHHPLSDRFLQKTWFWRSSQAEAVVRALAAYPRFVGYFGGHRHEYSHKLVQPKADKSIYGQPLRPFWEILAPSIQEFPQAGLIVRITALSSGQLQIKVEPFVGPYAKLAGVDATPCHVVLPEERRPLAEEAVMGRTGAIRDRKCRIPSRIFGSKLEKLATMDRLRLETSVVGP